LEVGFLLDTAGLRDVICC